MKETIYTGMAALADSSPSAVKETLEMMKDPETMREVQKLMQDPEFIKSESITIQVAYISGLRFLSS